MEEKIEKIIESIETSFIQLNNSVELLKKAEKTTTTATNTTSELISEFQTTISSIEKIVKIDFANEYNKLYDTNKKLIEKLDKINFNQQITLIHNLVTEKSNEILEFVIANNDFLDSFQEIINSIPEKVDELKSDIGNLNSEIKIATKTIENEQSNKFNEIIKIIGNQHKEITTLKTVLYVVCFLIVIGAIATILILKY